MSRRIPSFETRSLKSLCAAVVDCPHSTPTWLAEGKLVLRNYNIKNGRIDLSEPSYTDEETFNQRNVRITPRPGDLVISREAPMGEVAIIPDGLELCLGQRMVLLRADETVCDPHYLLYAMLSEYVQTQIAVSDASGSTVSNLCIPDLEALEIPYRPLPEQSRIADVLSVIDDKIENNKRLMSELEATARLVYDEWFVRFDFPDENGRPYRSSGGTMVWNDDLKREIPAGWGISPIGDLVSIERGYSYSSSDLCDNGFPMVSLASIDRRHHYRPEELKFLRHKPSDDCLAVPGDMLIACTDLTRLAEIVGCPIKIPAITDEFAFSMDLAKVTVTSPLADDWYLYMAMRTDSYHAFVKQFASGTNVLHLNLAGLDWYKIPLPPLSLQEHYSHFARGIWERSGGALGENQQLQSLRDWLLPMLMNGQVKVG